MLPVTLNYPNAGEGTGYTVGHPEPITLVETMGIQGSSASLMLLRKHTASFIDGLRKQIDAGQLSLEEGAKSDSVNKLLSRLKMAAFRGFLVYGPGDLPLFSPGRVVNTTVKHVLLAQLLPLHLLTA